MFIPLSHEPVIVTNSVGFRYRCFGEVITLPTIVLFSLSPFCGCFLIMNGAHPDPTGIKYLLDFESHTYDLN